jgi:hypothetical protein
LNAPRRKKDASASAANASRGSKGQPTQHLSIETDTEHIIARSLDGACGILAEVACDLANLARHQQNARAAKLATDALRIAESALRLADALHTELEV